MRARESWNWRVAGLIPAGNFIMSYALDRPAKWVDFALCVVFFWAFLTDDS